MLVKRKLNINALRPDVGATSVEYAIMASLIAAVIVVVVGVLGIQVYGLFDRLPPF
jgi:Flp pilus assembly pilin Flp